MISELINDQGRETSNKSPSQPRFPSDMTDAKFQFGKQPESFVKINYTSDLEIKNQKSDEQWFENPPASSGKVTPQQPSRNF